MMAPDSRKRALRGIMLAMAEIRALLLTDVVDSTKLSERIGDAAMAEVWIAHDRAARDLLPLWHGREIDKTDGMLLMFDTAADAVNYAMAYHRALAALPTPLKARAGLHVGPVILRENSAADIARGAKPLEVDGLTKPTAARVMSLGLGGQTLLSEDARRALDASPGPVQSLGHWMLKGLADPIELFEIGEDAAAFAAPLDGDKGYRVTRVGQQWLPVRQIPNNLPQQITSFVGRQRELEEAKKLLEQKRLLTLLGTGGLGKTRLSLQIAADSLTGFRDGVWFVDLAPIADPALVPKTVAQALRIGEDPRIPLIEIISAHLRSRRVLLVLDNCEHLIGACATLADALLRAAPELRILASSREPLHVPGEQAYPLQPLPLPDATARGEEVARSDAVRLFVERARLQQPHFAMTARNCEAVRQICARLDGIPLALELAAARVGVLPAEQIVERLDDRFRLLTGGSRTALPRQRTLRAMIDWSYDLLADAEKTFFARLSVFVGGWTLAAAETVAIGEGIEQGNVLDLLGGLVDKSLVVTDDSGERYQMLETIRQYAHACLQQSGHGAAADKRHRDYYLAFAEEAELQLNGGPKQPEWLARLDLEQDNLRAALAWSLEEAERTDADLRLCGALSRFWANRGHADEGATWCEKALARSADAGGTSARAKALIAMGTLAWRLGDMSRAQTTLEQALDLSRHLGVRSLEADALESLGGVAMHRTEFPLARVVLEQALALNRELGRPAQEAEAYNSLAGLAISQGDDEAAKEPLERALAVGRASGNKLAEARAMAYLALLAERRDQYTTAQAMHEQALSIAREFGVREFELVELRHLADVALNRGDMATARAHYRDALIASRDLGNRHRMAEMIEAVMDPTVAAGAFQLTAVLAGAADALRNAVATPRGTLQQQQRDPIVGRCRVALGEERYAAADAAGREMSGDEAVAAALRWLDGA
jgi:predicted ATPase/class 3 adenylate cyclase